MRKACRGIHGAPRLAVARHRLGQRRPLVVARITRIDRIHHLRHRPLQAFGDHRALNHHAASAARGNEPRIAKWRDEIGEVRARILAARSRGARRAQCGAGARGTVTVHAVDLDGIARLAVQVAVAVAVLREVAVDALHPPLEMNVLQVHRHACFRRLARRLRDRLAVLSNKRRHALVRHGGRETVGARVLHGMILGVDQISMTVALEDGAKDPAVSVKIGELRVRELRVEFGRARLRQERRITPQAANGAALGVAALHVGAFCRGEMGRNGRIHPASVGFVVPPGEPEVARHHVGAGMYVAHDALARRNRIRERVRDRMTRFVFRDHRIGRLCHSRIARLRVLRGMHDGPIVGVHRVACRASARAIVAGLVVGAEQIERRIHQPCLLKTDEYRVRTIQRAKAAVAEAACRASRLFVGIRHADAERRAPAALEDPQDVARRRHFPSEQWLEKGKDALSLLLARGRRYSRACGSRLALLRVELTETRRLERHRSVVVERGAPEHRAVRHHAAPDGVHFLRVAWHARLVHHAQVAGIHKTDKLRRLLERGSARPDGIGRRLPDVEPRLHVRPDLDGGKFLRALCHRRRPRGGRVSAVAIRAPDLHFCHVHRPAVRDMARDAPIALLCYVLVGLTRRHAALRSERELARRRAPENHGEYHDQIPREVSAHLNTEVSEQ